MGHKSKSKFMFPLPGRKSKEPTPTISAPLTKAQRILGTGEINVDSSAVHRDYSIPWDARSTSGISISVSESSMGRTNTAYGDDRSEAVDVVPVMGFETRGWEQESDIVPRHLHSSGGFGLRGKRSAATIGGEYRDGATDISSIRRRQSNSTIRTHYDKSNVPLSVSQQTSNSAIAIGPPSKASSLLDIESVYSGKSGKKKKPAKLDLSILRGKGRKDRNAEANVEPVLGNSYVMRSPSIMSYRSAWGADSNFSPQQNSPRKLITKRHPEATLQVPVAAPSHHRPVRDTTGLHQLYDHYEEMSFRNAPSPTDEDSPNFLEPRIYEPTGRPGTSRTSMSLPSSHPIIREPTSTQYGKSMQSPTSTRSPTSAAGVSEALGLSIDSKNEYASSISSRHTRTSKASRTDRSMLSLDRQQNSVLSLSDSDTDEEMVDISPRSSPASRFATTAHAELCRPDRRDQTTGKSSSPPVPQRGPSPEDLPIRSANEYLEIPRAGSRANASRTRSNSTLRSNHSSTSTISPQTHSASFSPNPSQYSGHSTGSDDEAKRQSIDPKKAGYGVHEAKTITFRPLASTAEAANHEDFTTEAPISNLQRMLSQRTAQPAGTTRSSRLSEQPTPPLSPNSVEFYVRSSPESTTRAGRPSSATSNSSETRNARFMAVTRQEEMLLAALRQKRAKMRESAPSEADSTTTSQRDRATSDASKKSSPPRHARDIPKRSSSIMGTSADAVDFASDTMSRHLGTLKEEGHPPPTSCSDPTQDRPTSIRVPNKKEVKARQERVLLYLDRPISRVNAIDFAEPSPDLTEFMGSIDGRSDDEWMDDQRKSRIKSRFSTSSKQSYFSRFDRGRPRADSAAVTSTMPPLPPMPGHLTESKTESHLHHGPIGAAHAGDDEDDDAYSDDIDFDDFPEPGTGTRTASSMLTAEERSLLTATPTTPVPPTPKSAMLTPNSAIKVKKSLARLSAVGGTASSPIPWWGDDD